MISNRKYERFDIFVPGTNERCETLVPQTGDTTITNNMWQEFTYNEEIKFHLFSAYYDTRKREEQYVRIFFLSVGQ